MKKLSPKERRLRDGCFAEIRQLSYMLEMTLENAYEEWLTWAPFMPKWIRDELQARIKEINGE